MMYFLIGLLVDIFFVPGTISGVVSLLITSVSSNIGRMIFSELLLSFMMMFLPLVVMVVLLLYCGVSCESLIFSCSHILFSCYESKFFLCAFFSESAERDQVPSCTDSLNE